MALKNIDAPTAARMQKDGALLVDIREAGEYAQMHIAGSELLSLSRFGMSELPLAPGQAVVSFCAGGNRTAMNATRLVEKAGKHAAYVMAGGINAWRQAGLPVETGGGEQGSRGGFFARMLGR
jgi:rhodanese-related sulfurtransferase